MKKTNINIMYILGSIITLFGVLLISIKDQTYLNDDLLHKIQVLATPPIIGIVLLFGLGAILVELFISKDYISLYRFIKKYFNESKDNKTIYPVLIGLLVYVLSFIFSGIIGIGILYIFVVLCCLLVCVISKDISYGVISLFLLVVFMDGTVTYEIVDKIWHGILVVVLITLLYGIYLISINIYRSIKKKNNRINLHVLFDYIALMFLGVFSEIGTYMKGSGYEDIVVKEPIFPLVSFVLIAFTVYTTSRIMKLKKIG